MLGATRPARPWERNEREMTNLLELATEWQCGLPAASWDVAMTPAARSSPRRWQHWRQATENDGEAHRREPSEQHGRRGRPGAQRELGGVGHELGGVTKRGSKRKKASAHPYLARQMSDFGFRQNP